MYASAHNAYTAAQVCSQPLARKFSIAIVSDSPVQPSSPVHTPWLMKRLSILQQFAELLSQQKIGGGSHIIHHFQLLDWEQGCNKPHRYYNLLWPSTDSSTLTPIWTASSHSILLKERAISTALPTTIDTVDFASLGTPGVCGRVAYGLYFNASECKRMLQHQP
jgi:hypothetical protein